MGVHLQCLIALLHPLLQIVSPLYLSRIFPYIYIIFLSGYKFGKFFLLIVPYLVIPKEINP